MQIILNEKAHVERLLNINVSDDSSRGPDFGGSNSRHDNSSQNRGGHGCCTHSPDDGSFSPDCGGSNNGGLRQSARPAYDLRLIARYYAQEYHLTPHKIYLKLIELMENAYDDFSIGTWQNFLLDCAKDAAKRPLVSIDYVPVTPRELEIIAAQPEKPVRRVAFTLLCLAKYRNLANEKNNDWINYAYRDIFKMANVSATVRVQCQMIRLLCDRGLIHMNRIVDNLSLRVLYVDHDSNGGVRCASDHDSNGGAQCSLDPGGTCGLSTPALKVTDFRNLGYLYLMHSGEAFIYCQNCGILMKPGKNGRKKYCSECAPIVNVMKQRLRDLK